jgi:hypothetical protein
MILRATLYSGLEPVIICSSDVSLVTKSLNFEKALSQIVNIRIDIFRLIFGDINKTVLHEAFVLGRSCHINLELDIIYSEMPITPIIHS